MSTRSDIIDGKLATTSRSGLVYTCQCGWVDLGHARPDGAMKLWTPLSTETGTRSKDGKGFQIWYGQSMSKAGLSAGVSNIYYVKLGLTHAQKESVALAIFMEVSMKFEGYQGIFPFNLVSDSSFSAEDLVSDLIGFYRAVRPGSDYITHLKPVSKAAAQKIWDTYGAVGSNKNHSFNPYLYPCDECMGGPAGLTCGELPRQFRGITPAGKGELFRKWRPGSD